MFQTQGSDQNSPTNRFALHTNHSTGQLIPGCRAQILRAKRENLRRKINHLANQIFTLKYDTQHQTQQLHKLTQKGQQIFQIASANLVKAKADFQQVLKPISTENEGMTIDLQEMKNSKGQISDRSTNTSVLTDRKSQPFDCSSQMSMQPLSKPKKLRRYQMNNFPDNKSNVKNLDLKMISMKQQSQVRKNSVQSSERYQGKSIKTELIKQTPIASILIIMVGVIMIILLI